MEGQNLRVFVNGKCIAVAPSCQFHVAAATEDSTTKDSEGMWKHQEVVSKSWDVSADALYDPEAADENTAITPAQLADIIITQQTPLVTLKFDATETTAGTKNRVGKNVGYTGDALLLDLSITAQQQAKVTSSFQFTGQGSLAKISPAQQQQTPA